MILYLGNLKGVGLNKVNVERVEFPRGLKDNEMKLNLPSAQTIISYLQMKHTEHKHSVKSEYVT